MDISASAGRAQPQNQQKIMLKILIGAAWIDGRIQPEERQHLRRLAIAQGLESDPEIHPLLNELVPVKPDQCYAWVRDYLGTQPTAAECQNLLEAVSALVYSDGEMAVEEAKLISRVQLLDPSYAETVSLSDRLLGGVRQIYHRWLGQQEL